MAPNRVSRAEALEELELEDGATDDEIRAAYKRAARIWHPDKNQSPEAKEVFQKKHAAYDRLVLNPHDSEDDLGDIFGFNFGFGRRRRGSDSDESEDEEVDFFAELFWDFLRRNAFHRSAPPRRGPTYSQPPRRSNMFYDDDDDDDDDDFDFGPQQEEMWRAHRQKMAEEEAQRRAEMNAAYEERLRANRAARAREAEEAAAAKVRAERQAALRQLPRPTTLQRKETSIQLHLRRDKRDSADAVLAEGCRYELQYRRAGTGGDAPWDSAPSDTPTIPLVTVDNLLPGTRYAFRARGGYQGDDKEMNWGIWSVESEYVTKGNPPAVAQPKEQKPAAVPEGFGKKARKRQAQAKGRMRGLGQGLEPQVDLEAERARIKEQKAHEAAVRATQERAAQEYRAEAARIAEAAVKATREAAAKAQARAKDKQPAKPRATPSQRPASVSSQGSSRESQRPSHYDFGGVRGVAGESAGGSSRVGGFHNSGSTGPQILTSSGGSYPPPQRPISAAQNGKPGYQAGGYGGYPGGSSHNHQPAWDDEDDDAALNEAIQLSLALEESKRSYENETKFFNSLAEEDAFPSLASVASAKAKQVPAKGEDSWATSMASHESADWDHPAPNAASRQVNGKSNGLHGSTSADSSQTADQHHSPPQPRPAVLPGDWEAAVAQDDSEPFSLYSSPSAPPPQDLAAPRPSPTKYAPMHVPAAPRGAPRAHNPPSEVPSAGSAGLSGPPGYQNQGRAAPPPPARQPLPQPLPGVMMPKAAAPYRPYAPNNAPPAGQASGTAEEKPSQAPKPAAQPLKALFPHLFPQEA